MKEKDKVAYLFEEAVGFFNQGEYRSAISAWEEILKYDPGNTQAQHGIRVATERMEAGGEPAAPPAAATPPAEAAPPAPPAPPAQQPAAGGGSDFDLGGGDDLFADDFGDPFPGGQPEAPPAPEEPAAPEAPPVPEGPPIVQPPMPGASAPQAGAPPEADLGAPVEDLEFPVEDLPSGQGASPAPPQAPPPASPAPPTDEDLGERVPASDDLSAWGLPSSEPTSAAPGTPSAGAGSEPQAPQVQPPAPAPGGIMDGLDDLGDPLGGPGEPEAAPSEPDEFGWGDEPAPPPPAAGEGSDFDDLGSVGELEDLALPSDGGEDLPPSPPAGEEPGFAERPEAEEIKTGAAPPPAAPSGGIFEEDDEDLEDFEGIPLSPPPPPDEAEEVEDLGMADLEPSSDTIPLAQPIPRAPTIPAPAPARKGGILMLLALAVVVVVIGGGGWLAWKLITSGGSDGPTGPTGPTGSTGPATPSNQAALLACREAMVFWRQKNPDQIIARGRLCLDEACGKLPGADRNDCEILGKAVPIMEMLQDRPVAYRRGYINGVLNEFCQYRNWRGAFLTIKELREGYPEFGSELDPFMAQIYRNLGVTELESDAPRDAIPYFEKGLELAQGDKDLSALLRFARVYRNKYTGNADYQDFVRTLRVRREGCPE